MCTSRTNCPRILWSLQPYSQPTLISASHYYSVVLARANGLALAFHSHPLQHINVSCRAASPFPKTLGLSVQFEKWQRRIPWQSEARRSPSLTQNPATTITTRLPIPSAMLISSWDRHTLHRPACPALSSLQNESRPTLQSLPKLQKCRSLTLLRKSRFTPV
jgi:hypothetical protein